MDSESSTRERTNTDEMPLGELYPNAIANCGIDLSVPVEIPVMEIVEPPQYTTIPPPTYSQVQKSHLTKNQLRNICLMMINLDLVLNFSLMLMSSFVHLYTEELNLTMLIPLAYFAVGICGRMGFTNNRPELLIIYCGAYFGRWFGDAAVLIYTLSIKYQILFEMKIYSLVATLPMVGMRGFYQDLLPCYSSNIARVCPRFLENASQVQSSLYLYWMVKFIN